MWPFTKTKKPFQIKAEKIAAELDLLGASSDFSVVDGDGFKQARYEQNGKPDYETYRKAQDIGNEVKIDNVFALPTVISAISNHARETLGEVSSILCHGTRNGTELRWFAEHFPDAEILGTDVASSASRFANTIQWDFHEMHDDWRGKWDVVYTNSWDHALEPERAFASWIESLRPGGILYLEHHQSHLEVDRLDLFAASPEALTAFVLRSGPVSAMPRFAVPDGREQRTILPFRRG